MRSLHWESGFQFSSRSHELEDRYSVVVGHTPTFAGTTMKILVVVCNVVF